MNRVPRTVLIAAAALMLSGPSAAQDALGRGDRLDRNTRVGSGGRNTPGRAENFRSRNLIITGDVAGGRGFRGAVGYTAADDFRGDLGSDDLFEFRAASALSDMRFQTFGHGYDAFRAGQDFGLVEYRRQASTQVASTSLPVGLAAFGASHETPADQFEDAWSPSLGPLTESRLRADRMLAGAMSASQQDVFGQPTPAGQVTDAEGRPRIVTFSGVRGLNLEDPALNVASRGLTTFDLMRAGEDQKSDDTTTPLGTPFGGRFEQLSVAGTNPTPAPSSPDAVRASSPRMDAILAEVAQRYAEAGQTTLDGQPGVLRGIDQDFDSLRQQLSGPTTTRNRREAANIVRSPDQPEAAEATTIRERMMALLDPDTEPLPGQMDLRDFSAVLRHGAQVESLSEADTSRFNELMSGGEEKLRSGEFFQAERRFTRALRYTPGHPLAMAGVAHAQLASGLHLTSSMTLRSLLTNRPEMIDVRYGADVLPPRPRIDAALIALREMVGNASRSASDRSAAGLLLAYLGHQLNDPALVGEGISALRSADATDPLLPVLELVWIGAASASDPPTDLPPVQGEAAPDAK